MIEFCTALKSLFDKITDLLEIFDLSFFISGVSFFSIILTWIYLNNCNIDIIFDNTYKILTCIIICYILGLISFASGRGIRHKLKKSKSKEKFRTTMFKSIKDHGLENEEIFILYLNNHNNNDTKILKRLYTRLWIEIRQCERLAISYSLLNKYWILTATYDGISFTIIFWIISTFMWTLGIGISNNINVIFGFILIIILIYIYTSCVNESKRLEISQIEELISLISYKKNSEISE